MPDLYFDGSVWCNIDVALRRLEPIYEQETEALGLSVIEWYVLRALYKQDGQMPSRLAEAVGRPATSFTPILDHIESEGLIERRKHTRDRRALKIHLTAQGRALEKRVKASATRIDNKLRREFFDKDWRGFEAVVAALQTMTP
jgi:MarR family transcriptional regulator, organic hydroperoxide resistance regulator